MAAESANLGGQPEIEQLLNQDWIPSFRADQIKAISDLIQVAIDAATKDKTYVVGPPITIVKISKDFSGYMSGYEGKCH